MPVKRTIEAVRWIPIAIGLAGIVSLYRHFYRASDTTVALSLLLFVLVLAGSWSLRYAIGASLGATILFDYYFLQPVGTLAISDTWDWGALFVFQGTAIFASYLASRIRKEPYETDARRLESEMLYRLGRQLLQPENVAQLLNFIPSSVANAFNSPAVTLYLADGDRIYLSDPKRISSIRVAWNPGDTPSSPCGEERTRAEIIRELREAMLHPAMYTAADGFPAVVPLRAGVCPRGVVLMEATSLSRETMEALGGMVSLSIARAEALEDSARSKAAKETERLGTALLDSVTHELRTPLTAIKTSITSLLSQPGGDDPARKELLTVIDEESDRLNRLIEKAVEMAQLDADKVHLEMEPQSVADLIQAVVHRFRLGNPAREVRVTLASFLPNVMVDRALIEKVLTNLLGNAAKYSASDQPIFVSADPQKDMLAISVADRGTGIDPMELSMIFDKFYRGQGQRARVRGTGMELAICRAIVNAHGGTIGATSQLGHGSVFTFTLPVARPS